MTTCAVGMKQSCIACPFFSVFDAKHMKKEAMD